MVRNLVALPKVFGGQLLNKFLWEQFYCCFFLTVVALVLNYSFTCRDFKGKWMLPLVNAIVTLLHCVYLKQSLHHILLDLCKYLMIQSSLWQMVRTRSGKDVYDDVPEFSTHHHGTFHPHVPPSSPPMLPVSLEQLLAPLNAIMQ
jgi:hypothetical protein